MKAYLILENKQIFVGESIGANKEIVSELVFNTSMSGYVEVLSDRSYAGQAVIMTYPLIGNYGVAFDDLESNTPYVDGFIVHSLARKGSNFRSNQELDDYLFEHNIPGIQGIDTRYLTKMIREQGTMKAMITTHHYEDLEEALEKIANYSASNVVEMVSIKRPYQLGIGNQIRIALYDFGAKRNIIHSLVEKGCKVKVLPASTKALDIINGGYDGVVLSNGPGDPKDCKDIIEEIKILIEHNIPIFGICLGHQLLALANGFDTVKMKYGHRGANHPVRDLSTGRIYISTQNHGYEILKSSIDSSKAEISFENVNDLSVEGITYKNKNVFSVQFHPEACSGPQDTSYLFESFIRIVRGNKNA